MGCLSSKPTTPLPRVVTRNTLNSYHLEIMPEQLKELMELKGKDAVTAVNRKYDGVQGLCRKLGVNPCEGLPNNEEDLAFRRSVYGDNEIAMKKSKSFLHLVWEALQDKTLIMLEISALISLALSFYQPKPEDEFDDQGKDDYDYGVDGGEDKYGCIEGIAIIISIAIIVLVSAVNDYNKERQFRGLQAQLEKESKVNVLRDKNIMDMSVPSLVVGDICMLKIGDVIPADGILFESNELKIDESSLTGESDLVNKSLTADPVLYSGTHVMEGSGRMVVTAVGIHSQSGVIYTLMLAKKGGDGEEGADGEEKTKSVLQNKLSDLAVKIGYVGIGTSIFTILMLIVRYSITKFFIEKKPFRLAVVKKFVDFLIVGITILVVAVPEGLPLAVTLSLAYSVKQMMKDNNLVRHLDACETMGNATTICSDKTGTLTANRMTPVQCFICGTFYRNLHKRYIELPGEVTTILSQNIALNSASTSRLIKDENRVVKLLGNKTECALLVFLFKVHSKYREVRKDFNHKDIVRTFPFNSTTKNMRTILRLPGKGFRLLAKGASEIILKNCSYVLGARADILELTDGEKERLTKEIITKMASDGLRTITLSYIDYRYRAPQLPTNCRIIEDGFEPDWESETSYQGMTCLGVVGIEDPLRKDVSGAIKKCQKAGITVRMVTGDNVDTARAIATKCGIISKVQPSTDLVLESREFNRTIKNEDGTVNQAKFDTIWPRLKVLARMTPTDKYLLVKHIIESRLHPNREVVAVTGDGTNDAPALKMADVGFAMGIAGTEVAKEASDIILTDDNFSSIVKSVIWGRNVYDSISKFIQFQLTVNVVAVAIAFASACVISESPLKAVQMLWVNLIMDTLGSLALSTEPPSKALLLRKPYGRNKSIITWSMFTIIALNAVYQFVILMLLLFCGDRFFGIDKGIGRPEQSPASQHYTIIFNAFVLMTLFNEINSRKINGERNVFAGIASNHIFCGIFLCTAIGQILIVHFGGISFSTVPLTCSQWLWCLVIGFSMLIWGQIVVSLTMKQKDFKWVQGMEKLCQRGTSDKATDPFTLGNKGKGGKKV